MKIVLGEFKENGDELAAFLEPRVGVKPKSSSDGLDIDDESIRKEIKPRHVKTYIKRFLLKKGERQRYKIIVEGKELTMVYLEREEEEKKEEEEEEKREKEKVKREEESQTEQAAPEETKEASESENMKEPKKEAPEEDVGEAREAAAPEGEAPKNQKKPRKKST